MKKILLICTLLLSLITFARKPISPNRYELLSGVRKTRTKKEGKNFWDQKYSNTKYVFGKVPAAFLARSYGYIPQGSSVLDMGMGEGRNAVFLARKGYKVTGVDISSVAVKKARLLADEYGVRINTVVASMDKYKIKPNSLDSIICFYYVDRKLNRRMISWLKPGGILIYESHTMKQRGVKGSQLYDPKYLLKEAELLRMFKGVRILKYEEPLHTGEFTTSIIIQKI